MPVVKSYQRQVSLAPIAAARKGHVATPQLSQPAFMPTPAGPAAVERFAGDLQKIAADLYTREIAKQDQVRALQVDRKLSDWELSNIHDREKGALSVTGEKAFELPDSVAEGYDKAAEEALKDLNGRQRRQAEARIAQRRASVMGTITGHVARQGEAVDAAEYEGAIRNGASIAVQSVDDLPAVDRQLEDIRIKAAERADRLGLPASARKAFIAGPVSDTHVGVINRLIDTGQLGAAKARFARAKDADEIEGGALSKLEAALTIKSTKADAQRSADIISGGGGVGMVMPGNLDPFDPMHAAPSFTFADTDGRTVLLPSTVNGAEVSQDEAIANYRTTGKHFGKFEQAEQADVFASNMSAQQERAGRGLSRELTLTEQRAQARLITDPDVREATEQRIAQSHAARKQDQAAADAEVSEMAKGALDLIMTNAKNALDRGSAFDAIPQAVRDRLPIEAERSLRSYAKQLVENGTVATDPATFYTLRKMAGLKPGAFAKVNMMEYVDKLDPTEWKQLVNLQSTVLKGDGEPKAAAILEGILTDIQMVDGAIADAGIDPELVENKDAKGRLLRALNNKVLALQEVTGKKATDKDKQQLLDDLVIQDVAPKKGSWFGPLYGEPFLDQPGSKRRFEGGAPAAAPAPSGPKEGTKAKNAKGDTLIYRGGLWVKP